MYLVDLNLRLGEKRKTNREIRLSFMIILMIGPMLEEKYGSQKILEVMGITALVTGLINYIFFPSVALCGASGVVFAFILLTSFTSFRAGELPVTEKGKCRFKRFGKTTKI